MYDIFLKVSVYNIRPFKYMFIYAFILLLTLRNASKAPFSMYSITIMTGFPERKEDRYLRTVKQMESLFFDKMHAIPLKD